MIKKSINHTYSGVLRIVQKADTLYIKFLEILELKKVKILLVVLSLLVIGLVIEKYNGTRWFGYETVPTAITDEFDYTWQGLSLRAHGVPVAWTTSEHVYRNPKFGGRGGNLEGFGVKSDGKLIDLAEFKKDSRPIIAIEQIDYMKGVEHMFFVAPFFEHPPLGGLIFSLAVGPSIQKVDQVKPDSFRRSALVASVFTTILLSVFLYSITSNPLISIIGGLVYQTVPTYVFATRTSFLENIVSPLILIHLILLYWSIYFISKKSFKSSTFLIVLSGIFGGLSFLAKESAAGFLIGSVVLVLIHKVPKRFLILFIVNLAIPVLGYIFWGLWLQKEIFIEMLATNATRNYFGALKPVTMLEALKFKNYPIDGWWFFGLLSFVVVALTNRKRQVAFLLVPLFTNYLTLLLTGSENYAWYLISMIPFLAGCSGLLLWEVIKRPTLVNSISFFLIAFSSSYYWGREALGIHPDINHYRMIVAVFGLFLYFRLFFYSKYKVIELVWMLFMGALLYKVLTFNQLSIHYFVANWGHLSIPSSPVF